MRLFWRGLIRYERQKVNPRLALRNALGIGIPLAVGVALGQAAGGLMASIGALDVAFSDGSDPYQFRVRRMLAASFLVAAAVFLGGLAGHSAVMRLGVSGGWAFAAGMMVAVGPLATDMGNITLVTVIVFSAHPMGLQEAWLSALAALGGGLFQTALAIAWWPVDRYAPERRALSALYGELARAAASANTESAPAAEAPVASPQSTQAQNELAALGGDGSIQAERYFVLLSQAERIRLSILALTRARIRLGREGAVHKTETIDRRLAGASVVLEWIAAAIDSGEAGDAPAVRVDGDDPLVDSLGGQLRSAVDLAGHATPAGVVEFARQQARQPWTLRATGAWAALRANFCRESGAFRHAVRLAVAVPAADLLTIATGLPRGYWAAMTAAIVLRPDFASTFSRSLLRIAGTMAGLGMATALFHFLVPAIGWQVALLTAWAFVLRCWGPANYGIFAIALTALVVLLLAVTGLAPAPVILARGINTAIGGSLGLVAYVLWPTWERSLVRDALAQLLDAYRAYFRAVGNGYLTAPDTRELDRTRLAARLARSNLEASVARLRAEPATHPADMLRVDAVVANSLRFIHSAMALEAGLYRSRPVPARAPFRPFLDHVDLTLHYLAAVLRGSPAPSDHLPDLRADHHALADAETGVERHALVDVETDRVTNSVNTLARELLDWQASGRSLR